MSAPRCSTFSWNFKRIGISICKPRNYLDYVTREGKGPRVLDVSAAIASQTRVRLRQRTGNFCNVWVCSFGIGGIV